MATKKTNKRAPKKKQGRPTVYTDELSDRFCALLAEGLSVRTICKSEEFPCAATIFLWLRSNKSFLEQYTRAKQESADALVDEMLDIADDGTNDWMERLGEDGKPLGWQLNGEHVQRSRVRIETRKWISSKLKPKKYGDKIQHAGHDGGPLNFGMFMHPDD
ncbi:MAG: terminase small subunit protein [Nevskiales bacterium]